MQWVNAIPTLGHLWSSIPTLGHLLNAIPTWVTCGGLFPLWVPCWMLYPLWVTCVALYTLWVTSRSPYPLWVTHSASLTAATTCGATTSILGPPTHPWAQHHVYSLWVALGQFGKEDGAVLLHGVLLAVPCPHQRLLDDVCLCQWRADTCHLRAVTQTQRCIADVPLVLRLQQLGQRRDPCPAKSQTCERFKTQQRAKHMKGSKPSKEPNNERFKTQQRAKHGKGSKPSKEPNT